MSDYSSDGCPPTFPCGRMTNMARAHAKAADRIRELEAALAHADEVSAAFEKAAWDQMGRIRELDGALREIRRRAIFGPAISTGDILDLTQSAAPALNTQTGGGDE
jgi:hypothetical protein